MKKYFLLVMSILVLTGCEIEDDGPDTVQVWAEVVDADLPESFEQGEIYDIDITYLLPDACHTPLGVRAYTGGDHGSVSRDIYVAGFASRPAGQDECSTEGEDLEKTSSFKLRIDDDEPYTFYLWTGVDEDEENVYTKIIVPVEEETTPTTAVK